MNKKICHFPFSNEEICAKIEKNHIYKGETLMAKVIIIYGDLAAGKTGYANILANKFRCPAITKDSIKEILGDKIGFANRAENRNLSETTFEIMLHTFECFTKVKADIILEANFRDRELREIKALAEKNGYDIVAIQMSAPTEILYDRFTKRMRDRHPVHLTIDFDDYEGFVKYVEGQRSNVDFEHLIKIDTSDFGFLTDESIILEIDKAILPTSMHAALEKVFSEK